uniref:Uncharacterized protein n=1 Tax=Arundo donax TaxID=35708 RepID=A0A0A9E9E2_ARUDO
MDVWKTRNMLLAKDMRMRQCNMSGIGKVISVVCKQTCTTKTSYMRVLFLLMSNFRLRRK